MIFNEKYTKLKKLYKLKIKKNCIILIICGNFFLYIGSIIKHYVFTSDKDHSIDIL